VLDRRFPVEGDFEFSVLQIANYLDINFYFLDYCKNVEDFLNTAAPVLYAAPGRFFLRSICRCPPSLMHALLYTQRPRKQNVVLLVNVAT
jgi:hypothetical protein